MFEVGQETFITQVDSANGVISADGERAIITHVGTHTNQSGDPLCYVEWVDRPLRHQRNGAFRPFTQLFLAA